MDTIDSLLQSVLNPDSKAKDSYLRIVFLDIDNLSAIYLCVFLCLSRYKTSSIFDILLILTIYYPSIKIHINVY